MTQVEEIIKKLEEFPCRMLTIAEAQVILEVLKGVKNNNDWIPVKVRDATEEEKVELSEMNGLEPDDITHIFDCSLPDDGDEIIISQCGKYVSLVTFANDDYGVGDDYGNDWEYEVDAWMPIPKPYVKEKVKKDD